MLVSPSVLYLKLFWIFIFNIQNKLLVPDSNTQEIKDFKTLYHHGDELFFITVI